MRSPKEEDMVWLSLNPHISLMGRTNKVDDGLFSPGTGVRVIHEAKRPSLSSSNIYHMRLFSALVRLHALPSCLLEQ